jgi:hypothetical protein
MTLHLQSIAPSYPMKIRRSIVHNLAHARSLDESPLATSLASPPPAIGSIQNANVAIAWTNILQSEVLQMLAGIDVPQTGPFIDYRYWANGVLRWALSQQDDNGNPLYAFAIPSWETGFDDSGNPVVGAFLFPVGTQVTVLQPTDDELNTALATAYRNQPALSLTENQTGDPDERRWAAAAHAYALSQTDANGNPYIAGIPSWEMAIEGGQTYRGVFAFSATSGIQVLKAGRAALMDQIIDGILEPAGNANLMDTDMRTLAVAGNRWAMRYGAVCGAGTFGYCYSPYQDSEGNELFYYTHDIVICFAPQQPTMDLLQTIVDQPAVDWPDYGDAYSALCSVLGNIYNTPGSGQPIDPRSLAASPSWSSGTIDALLGGWLQFDSNGDYSLSPAAPNAPAGVDADDWLQIIHTVWQELNAVAQLQALYSYTKGTLTSAQSTANSLITGAIINMQAKTGSSVLMDFGQMLKDIGYSLVWFFSGTGAAWANLAVTAVTDVVKIVTSALGGSSSSVTIGKYWENVAKAFGSSSDALDQFYQTIASDHGRLLAFYIYADSGNLPIPASNPTAPASDSDTATAMANGLMLQTYQTLMPLFWAIGCGAPMGSEGNQALYGEYDGLTIPEAPDGTYVEGPYYEFAIIWYDSGAIKSYPTQAMMNDLTQTLNVNFMDIVARTDPWLGIAAWFGWSAWSVDEKFSLQGPCTR